MGSGSKGKRPFPGLRFDVRVGNANTMMMLNWDAGVRGRGRKRGGGRGGGRRRGDVRNNTTTKGKCTSPKVRPRDQDWSQFEADSPGFAADLAARAVAAF